MKNLLALLLALLPTAAFSQGAVNTYGQISGPGSYLAIAVDAGCNFTIRNSTAPTNGTAVPVRSQISGAGRGLLLTADAANNFAYTVVNNIPNPNVPVVGYAAGAITQITLNPTADSVIAGTCSTTLSALVAGGVTGDVFINFSNMADGAPGAASGAQPTQREPANLPAGVVLGVVSSGAYTAPASGAATTASYSGWQLLEDIQSTYAIVSFGDANDGAALIATSAVAQASVGATSVHIIFTYNSWAVQYFSDATGSPVVTTVQSGFMPAVTFGARVRLGWRLSGNDIIVLTSDGTEVTVTSTAITTRANHSLIFEHYRSTTGAPGTKFYSVAANLYASPTASGRTQLFVSPGDLTNAAWIKNALSAPTSSPPGQQVLETAINDIHWVYQNYAAKPAAQWRMSMRFRVKLVGRDWTQLVAYDGALAGQAARYLNLTTQTQGTMSGTFTDQYYMIYPIPDQPGFYQVQSDFLTNTTAGFYGAIALATADGNNIYVGDPSKGMIIYDAWLFQRPI